MGLGNPDGCSEATMDGYMASHKKSSSGLGQEILSFRGNQKKLSSVVSLALIRNQPDVILLAFHAKTYRLKANILKR